MRQVWVTYPGPAETLLMKESQDPTPLPGEVLIRSHAIGVNFADVLVRMGRYPLAPPTPCVPGFEVAGVVEKIGDGVSLFSIGDRVVTLCRFGGYSDIVSSPEAFVFHLPSEIDFHVAAAVTVNYLTASLLVEKSCSLKPKERVLIHSAAGGVGLALVDLCKRLDCEIVALASPEKHSFLRDRGVRYVHNSREADFLTPLRALFPESGFDAVFDSKGGASWKQSYQLLSAFGRLGVFGFSSIAQPEGLGHALHSKKLGEVGWFDFDAYHLVNDNKTISGVNLATLWNLPSFIPKMRPMVEALIQSCAKKEIEPWIDRTFPLEETPLAHEYLQSRKSVGKVLLTP